MGHTQSALFSLLERFCALCTHLVLPCYGRTSRSHGVVGLLETLAVGRMEGTQQRAILDEKLTLADGMRSVVWVDERFACGGWSRVGGRPRGNFRSFLRHDWAVLLRLVAGHQY